MEIYEKKFIVVNQDEAIIFGNDCKMYTWARKGEIPSIYFNPNRYIYTKITIYAIITSNGDFYYMMTSSNFNKYAFLYFL